MYACAHDLFNHSCRCPDHQSTECQLFCMATVHRFELEGFNHDMRGRPYRSGGKVWRAKLYIPGRLGDLQRGVGSLPAQRCSSERLVQPAEPARKFCEDESQEPEEDFRARLQSPYGHLQG